MDGSAVKKTWGQYKENASIPWKKKVISEILQDLEYPILLRDLKDSTFHPQFPLNDSIYFLSPERSPRGNFLLRPIVEAYNSNPADQIIPEELDFFPIERISAEFEVSVLKSMYGLELLTKNLSPKVFQMLTNFRLMDEMNVGPLLRVEGNKGFYFGSIPTHKNKELRSSYYEGYLTCLFSNVMRKESRKEQIIVRKSAIQESDDTEMKLPGHFFTSAQTTYHFYLEEEEISLLLSLKNGYLQIVRVKNYHDVKVFHSTVEALVEDGYVTTKSVKSELEKISSSLVFVDKENGYEQFRELMFQKNLIGELTSLKPSMGVLTDLLTPSAIGQHETIVEAKQLMDKGQDLWFEDWVYYVQLGMKLFATLQDPGSKQIMSLLTREYKRGELRGNSTKFKMWGIKANLIKPSGKKSHSANRNRAHYVRGFNRRQPIKNIDKYQGEGYLILEEDGRFFVDKQISPHWRGNKELGTIETIYHLGDSTKGSYSNKAVRWLQAISAEMNIEIKHAKNGGEQVFPAGNGRYIRVDGFCESTNQVFEFYGDYWHGNPEVFDPEEINKSNKKTFSQLYEETLEREEWIRGLGFELVTIWENEFDKPKKSG